MNRTRQILFLAGVLGLSWMSFLVAHEAGHMIGALLTGGRVTRVVLDPLAISRTDISPNPFPHVVVWMGPLIGSLGPVAIWALMPDRLVGGQAGRVLKFVCGGCLIGNGAYIFCGAFEGIGDCQVMLACGSARWTLFAFGLAALLSGIMFWHFLGSPAGFWARPESISNRSVTVVVGLFLIVSTVCRICWPSD